MSQVTQSSPTPNEVYADTLARLTACGLQWQKIREELADRLIVPGSLEEIDFVQQEAQINNQLREGLKTLSRAEVIANRAEMCVKFVVAGLSVKEKRQTSDLLEPILTLIAPLMREPAFTVALEELVSKGGADAAREQATELRSASDFFQEVAEALRKEKLVNLELTNQVQGLREALHLAEAGRPGMVHLVALRTKMQEEKDASEQKLKAELKRVQVRRGEEQEQMKKIAKENAALKRQRDELLQFKDSQNNLTAEYAKKQKEIAELQRDLAQAREEISLLQKDSKLTLSELPEIHKQLESKSAENKALRNEIEVLKSCAIEANAQDLARQCYAFMAKHFMDREVGFEFKIPQPRTGLLRAPGLIKRQASVWLYQYGHKDTNQAQRLPSDARAATLNVWIDAVAHSDRLLGSRIFDLAVLLSRTDTYSENVLSLLASSIEALLESNDIDIDIADFIFKSIHLLFLILPVSQDHCVRSMVDHQTIQPWASTSELSASIVAYVRGSRGQEFGRSVSNVVSQMHAISFESLGWCFCLDSNMVMLIDQVSFTVHRCELADVSTKLRYIDGGIEVAVEEFGVGFVIEDEIGPLAQYLWKVIPYTRLEAI